MTKPLIGLLCVAALAFGVKWYGARGEVNELRARLEAVEKRVSETPRPVARSSAGRSAKTTVRLAPAEANGVRVDRLSEEQQAAVMLAAIAGANQESDELAEAERKIEMLRRQIERIESAKSRAEKARQKSGDDRQKMLRERQALIDENVQLRDALAKLTAAIAEASEKPAEPFIRRR